MLLFCCCTCDLAPLYVWVVSKIKLNCETVLASLWHVLLLPYVHVYMRSQNRFSVLFLFSTSCVRVSPGGLNMWPCTLKLNEETSHLGPRCPCWWDEAHKGSVGEHAWYTTSDCYLQLSHSAKHHMKIVVCKGDDLFEGETCQQSKDSVGAEYAAMENKLKGCYSLSSRWWSVGDVESLTEDGVKMCDCEERSRWSSLWCLPSFPVDLPLSRSTWHRATVNWKFRIERIFFFQ